MRHFGRFGCIAIVACASLAGESAVARFEHYREAADRCRFLVNESRTREAEQSCREAVTRAGQLPAAAKRERIDANSLAAQVYLDLGLPEDALSFAGPASKLAQAGLPATDMLRGTVRYQLARCHEALGRLQEAQQDYEAAARDLDAAVHRAPSQRKASATLRDALQSYRQLLSAEGKNDQAAAIAKQLGEAAEPTGKP